jgi:hypothetical protein
LKMLHPRKRIVLNALRCTLPQAHHRLSPDLT